MQAPVEEPAPGFGDAQRVGEQGGEFMHRPATFSQSIGEDVMLLAGLLHP